MTKSLWLTLIAVSSAFGGTIISSPTGLSNPGSTLTFSEIVLADSTALTSQYAGLGVTFTGFFYNPCQGCATAQPSGVKPDIGNFANGNTGAFNQNLAVSFTSPVTGAAFQLAANGAPFTFTAFLGPNQVDSIGVTIATASINGSNGWGWYGFSGETFDRIQINAGAAMLMDNLEFTATATPEPSSLALTGIGLIFAIARVCRRSKKDQAHGQNA